MRPRSALVPFALATSVALAVAACGGGQRAPAASGASESPIAQIHRARCGACHVRVEPGERTRDQLEAALARHRKRVHLSEEQWAAMVDYLAAPTTAPQASAPLAK